jgi:CRP-like cAMP-binding protein
MSQNSKSICLKCDSNCILRNLLTIEEKNLFTQHITTISYRKKETIVKQNSHCDYILYVKSGLIKLFTERKNDKNIILNIVASNNFMDLTNIFTSTYLYSAIALKDTEICLIPKDHFKKIIHSNIPFSSSLINKISSLGTKQMHGRLAEVILFLCSNELDKENTIEHLTRKEIAELSGMSAEGAIRLLTEFKNDGLININGKNIEINNEELLKRLSDIG